MKLLATFGVALLALTALTTLAPTASAIPDPVCVQPDNDCPASAVACVLYPVQACVINPCSLSGCATAADTAPGIVLVDAHVVATACGDAAPSDCVRSLGADAAGPVPGVPLLP